MFNKIYPLIISGFVSLIVSLVVNHIKMNGTFSYNKLPALISCKITKNKIDKLGKCVDGVHFYEIEKIKKEQNTDDYSTIEIKVLEKPINVSNINYDGIILEFKDVNTNSMMLKVFSMGNMILNLSNATNVDENINADNKIIIFLKEYTFPIEIKGEIMNKQFIYLVRNESSSNKAKIIKR